MSTLKYANRDVDRDKLFSTYNIAQQDLKYYELYLREVATMYRKNFLKYKGEKINDSLYEDIFQEVSINSFLLFSTKKVFNNAPHIYGYIDFLCRNCILNHISTYDTGIVRLDDDENTSDFIDNLSDNAHSAKTILETLNNEYLVKLFVRYFKFRIRFTGLRRKACLYVFDCKLKNKEPLDNVIYHDCDDSPKYIKSYVDVLFRSCIYDIRVIMIDDTLCL